MAIKLTKQKFPAGHSPSDFKCFGPPATKDGSFDDTYICDMGCFKQDGTDSNKFYHSAVVQSNIDDKWYSYFEWGRTGASSVSFQFIECSSKNEAWQQYSKQLHAKNDKRGQWVDTPFGKVLQAKPKKDCYLVRPQATRSTGLPDAKTITQNDGVKTTGKKKKSKSNFDKETLSLLNDLSMGTVSYTRGSMADSALPTQSAIDEARDILQHAMKRTKNLSLDDQINDKELKDYTNLIYSRIPKKKTLKAKPEQWLLTINNIQSWQQDLDAFESALYGIDSSDTNPFEGLETEINFLSKTSKDGEFIYTWLPKATRNRHSYLNDIKIKNVWSIERKENSKFLDKEQKRIEKYMPSVFAETAMHQPNIELYQSGIYKKTNTCLLVHGTRSVNVGGILREGFRFPKELTNVAITGAMFSGGGAGVYFACDYKKSVGYTSAKGSYWSSGSGSIKNRNAFLILCDVVLGVPHVAPGPHPYTSYPKGTNCIFGKAGKSGVQNNEWIILSKNQYKMRYLIEFGI